MCGSEHTRGTHGVHTRAELLVVQVTVGSVGCLVRVMAPLLYTSGQVMTVCGVTLTYTGLYLAEML